jgi:hypothetical protein
MFRTIRVAVPIVIGALLALCVGAAGAYFTAQVQVPDSIIKTGSVAISTVPTVAALSIDGLAPGVVVNKYCDVINEGTLPVDVVVTGVKKAGSTALYDALTCRVTRGSVELYSGNLNALNTIPLRLTPAGRGDIQFAISMPATQTSAVMNDYVKLSLYVDAEQAH